MPLKKFIGYDQIKHGINVLDLISVEDNKYQWYDINRKDLANKMCLPEFEEGKKKQ